MIERKARRAVWVTWDYPAGADSLEGFRERKSGSDENSFAKQGAINRLIYGNRPSL